MVLFRIPDRLICVTLSLNGSTSMLSFSSRLVSGLDGSIVAIFWLDWLYGIKTIRCCWLSVWHVFLYRYWLLLASGTVKVWVGVHVDVLTTGGGVPFCFWSVVWVKFLVLEDCLVSGGDVRVILFCLK